MNDTSIMDSLCQSTHLNSPLSVTVLNEALRTREHRGKPRNISIQNLISEIDELEKVSGKTFCLSNLNQEIQRLIGPLYNWGRRCDVSTHSEQRYIELWASVRAYIPASLKSLDVIESSYEDKIPSILEYMTNPTDHQYLLSLYEMREFFEGGVCLSSKPKRFLINENCSVYPAWRLIKDPIKGSIVIHGVKRDNISSIEIFLSSRLCLIIYDGLSYLVSRNHFLLLSDILSQRSIIHESCVVAQFLGKINYPPDEEIRQLFGLGDLLLQRYGNKAYTSLSLWESLGIGEILSRKEDPATNHVDFLNKMIEEFIISQGDKEIMWMSEFYNFWIDPLLSRASQDYLFQLFGLYRIWGHPTIDELEGVRKLKTIACRQRVLNPHVINHITYKWREYFSMSYFQKHKKWPQLVIKSKAPSSPLIKALKEGVYISPYSNGYRLTDWHYIKFEKTFEIPEKFELSEMISDKALSLNIDELKEECKKGSIGASYSRNVILKWLETNYNNPSEFLKKIEVEGFDKRETVIGLHPKERELKLYARMFGLLTIEKRLYVVVTEAMLADYIFEYFPEITMTFDSITLQTKIHTNTLKQTDIVKRNKKNMNNHSVIVNMDFNKWNSYMREQETYNLFTDFDHLFGLRDVFSRTHEMFRKSIMYLADGTLTPFDRQGNVIDSEGVWNNHLGGIEGLRQKGWTIFTVIILKYIAELEGIDCQIMGQGDNQVLIVTYSKDNRMDIQSQHEHFLKSLDNLLKFIGPPLKKEETWSSSYFFIYGKFPVYQGRPLSMSLKKLCRTMRLTNEGFQNLESTLSSITANASAATASDYDPIIPFIIGSIETIGAIRLHMEFPFYSTTPLKNIRGKSFLIPKNGETVAVEIHLSDYWNTAVNKLSPWLLVGLAIQPCILGGFPTLQLCDLMNHGFPDPLSLNLWSLKQLYNNLEEPYHKLRHIILNILNPIINSTVNPDLLCQDPVSLNLLKPSSGTEKLKSAVFDFLTNSLTVNNQHFITFLKLAKGRQKELSEILYTMNPLNPRIANSIISSTIVGRAMKVVSKVNKTSTIIGLMLKFKQNQSSRVLEDVESGLGLPEGFIKRKLSTAELFGKFEENYLKGVLYQLLAYRPDIKEMSIQFCSTSKAYELRLLSWKKPISGVTVCVPQECFKWTESTGEDCKIQSHLNEGLGYIMVRSSIPLKTLNQHNYHFSKLPLGPFKPYFGSRTKNKVKYEGGDLKITAPPLIRGILDCMALIGWGTSSNSNLSTLLRAIFSSFTDLDSNYIIPDISSISGSVEHRWQDMRTSHYSSISILYDLLTHMTVTTNSFRPELYYENTGTDNFNVSFQTIFTWIGSTWSYLLSNNRISATSYHLHVQCLECIKPINETLLEIDDPSDVIKSIENSRSENNPYCWVPSQSLLGGTKLSIPTCWVKREFTEDTPPRVLTWGVVAYYLNNFPLFISDTVYNSRVYETSEVIPISVSFVIDPFEFLKDLIGITILSYCLLRSPALIKRVNKDMKTIINEVRDSLTDIPLTWFRGMISLNLNREGMITLLKRVPGLALPKGTPPSLIEKCTFFKKAFVAILLTQFNSNSFSKWLTEVINLKSSLYSDFIYFNPMLWKCFRLSLSDNLSASQNGMSMISLIRYLFTSTHSTTLINSNTNFLTLATEVDLPLEMKWILPYFNQLCQSHTELNGVCYSGVIDKMSKILKTRRIKLEETKLEREDPFTWSMIDLHSLPAGVISLLLTQQSDLPKLGFIRLDPHQFIPTSRSLLNHYYKPSGITTTAPYKLLSILSHIKTSLLNLNVESSHFYCVGDGVGGYTTLIGRVFPNVKLLYNTFFEVENLSSSGLDDYIPGSLGMFPSILRRVENIQEVIETCSDLTDKSILNNKSFDIPTIKMIISDAEGGGWTDPSKALSMLSNLLTLASRHRVPHLLFKTYGSRLDSLYSQVILLKNYYHNVEILRSQFSSIGNTEVFLYGSTPRSHVGSVEILMEDQNGTKIINISGNIKIKHSLHDFSKLFCERDFILDCENISEQYSKTLRLEEWESGSLLNLKLMLGLNEKSFKFPEDLIYKWRREFNLIRFTKTRTSHLKLNFVNNTVLAKIIEQYLLVLSLRIKNKKDFQQWEKIILTGYAQLYASIDLSWSFALTQSSYPISQNCVVKKLTDCLSTSMIKNMIVEASLLSNLQSDNVEFSHITLYNWETRFVMEFDLWWSIDKMKYLKIPFTPILSYKFDKALQEYTPRPLRLYIPLDRREERDAVDILDWIYEDPDVQDPAIELYQNNEPYLIPRSQIKVRISRKTLTLDYLISRMKKQ